MEVLKQMYAVVRDITTTFYGGAEHDFELHPMYLLFQGEKLYAPVILANLPEDSLGKNLLVLKIRAMADEHKCDGWIFLSEGWTLPEEKIKDYAGGLRFSEQPDRVEVLSICGGLESGETFGGRALITRTPGQPPQLQWEEPMYSTDGGTNIRARWNIYDMQVPDAAKLAALRSELPN